MNRGSSDSGFLLAEWGQGRQHPGHDSNFKEFGMALTDTNVRQAKAAGTACTLGDIDGLSLAVSPQGGKSWRFRYYWMARQKRMSLGAIPKSPCGKHARPATKRAPCSPGEKRSTHAWIVRIFGKDILPYPGKQSILEIRRPDLLEVLARIERRKALAIARQVRGFLNRIFRFALVKVPGLETNQASDLDVVAPLTRPSAITPSCA
jgi:hypothetical protein